MGKIKDIKNQSFGKLKVIEFQMVNKNGIAVWQCECECGRVKAIRSNHLRSGHTQSCGCLNKSQKKHELTYKPLYAIWRGMKARCYNKNNLRYKDYGGRGIIICDEWKNDFESFYQWSRNNGYEERLSIDRIDNDKGYHPDNCRWATIKEQNRNTRSNHCLELNGEIRCIAEWCELLNINRSTLYSRLRRNKSISDTLLSPINNSIIIKTMAD